MTDYAHRLETEVLDLDATDMGVAGFNTSQDMSVVHSP